MIVLAADAAFVATVILAYLVPWPGRVDVVAAVAAAAAAAGCSHLGRGIHGPLLIAPSPAARASAPCSHCSERSGCSLSAVVGE